VALSASWRTHGHEHDESLWKLVGNAPAVRARDAQARHAHAFSKARWAASSAVRRAGSFQQATRSVEPRPSGERRRRS
jgi:hypothetical protein